MNDRDYLQKLGYAEQTIAAAAIVDPQGNVVAMAWKEPSGTGSSFFSDEYEIEHIRAGTQRQRLAWCRQRIAEKHKRQRSQQEKQGGYR